jgi:hypothetical protein
MRMNQSQNQARYSQPSEELSPESSTPPGDVYAHLRPSPSACPDSPSTQLQLEAAQQQNSFTPYPQHNDFAVPLDPALMEGIRSDSNLAELPPSPFLAAGEGSDSVTPMNEMEKNDPILRAASIKDERAPTAREEIRRRLDRVAAYGPK